MSSSDYRFNTRAIHSGQRPDPSTGAIMTPVYLSSTFVQKAPGQHKGFEYGRTGNPTREAYERCVADLEGARFGFAFASGMAATDTLLHLLDTGAHVVCADDVYGGTYRLFENVLTRSAGLRFSFVDFNEPHALETAITDETALIWVETPTNPMLKLFDLAQIAEVARAKGIRTVCDNTFMSPYFQNPLALGFDVVMHSATKYLNGHSDIVGGVVVTDDDELAERLYYLQNSVGGVAGPFDSFMCMRGIKTLGVRMERHAENALRIATWLEKHPKVERVAYPGLESHPQHELARKQMRGFGGMVSVWLKADLEETKAFLQATTLFSLAESLGGVESLIEHPAIMTHAAIPAERRRELGITDGFIRLSVGIEDGEDLIADLDVAMKAMS